MENPFAQVMQSQAVQPKMQDEENPFSQLMGGNRILPNKAPVTQPFGNHNPSVEVMSGGTNYGTDFGAQEGTPVSLPPGTWEVVESYSGESKPGYIGNSVNKGYGNSVLVKNLRGEKLRLSHLSENQLQPGQIVTGGKPIGRTGQTGNVTGPHLDLEYYNEMGQIADVLQSPYGQYLQ